MNGKKQSHTATIPAAKDPEDFLSPVLGPLLLRARKSAGMKQDALAEKIGVNDATLRRIEGGRGPLQPRYVRAICQALGADYEEILTEALFTFWNDLRHSGAPQGARPLELLREKILLRVDAHQKTERDLVEAYLDFETFVHFKTKWEDVVP